MTNLSKYQCPNPVQQWLIRRFLDRAAEIVRDVPSGLALDAGCGEGFFGRALQTRLPDRWWCCGFDLEREALAELQRRRTPAVPVQGDLTWLPFADRTFELVVATEVLEHLPHPAAALQELTRVARRHLLLSVPWEPFFAGLNLARGRNLRRLGSDPDHCQHWTRGGFIRFLQRRLRVCAAPVDTFPWTLVLAEVRE